jgi:hypothetical protein
MHAAPPHRLAEPAATPLIALEAGEGTGVASRGSRWSSRANRIFETTLAKRPGSGDRTLVCARDSSRGRRATTFSLTLPVTTSCAGPDKASPERTLLPSDCHASQPSAEEYEEWSGAQLKGYVDEIAASGSMSREAAEEQGRHSGSDDRRVTGAEGKEPHATSGSTR